ncbi:TerB family tellurite resistance protein [Aerophototrophica crusticola]|uniref:TerB family tellurite resistance protein n=1 Tax=Aerophototrophica crusticola TaxID=1709002 RepID=A0A858R3X1_9PROT|nr:TerB family tellurite resistance protein [Rhodospirillaceae bacterium B3]
MLNRIRRLFDQPDRALDSLDRTDRIPLSAACLLMEAARLDGHVSGEELSLIHALVQRHFRLTKEEADELVAAAHTVTDGPAQWHAFTSRLNDSMAYEEKVGLVEMLWEVAYADGRLNDLESSLLRRMGGLLYVSDRDRGEAQRRVKARLGLPQGPAIPD